MVKELKTFFIGNASPPPATWVCIWSDLSKQPSTEETRKNTSLRVKSFETFPVHLKHRWAPRRLVILSALTWTHVWEPFLFVRWHRGVVPQHSGVCTFATLLSIDFSEHPEVWLEMCQDQWMFSLFSYVFERKMQKKRLIGQICHKRFSLLYNPKPWKLVPKHHQNMCFRTFAVPPFDIQSGITDSVPLGRQLLTDFSWTVGHLVSACVWSKTVIIFSVCCVLLFWTKKRVLKQFVYSWSQSREPPPWNRIVADLSWGCILTLTCQDADLQQLFQGQSGVWLSCQMFLASCARFAALFPWHSCFGFHKSESVNACLQQCERLFTTKFVSNMQNISPVGMLRMRFRILLHVKDWTSNDCLQLLIFLSPTKTNSKIARK